MESRKREFTISTNKYRLNLEVIQSFFVNESYWAKNRTPQQTIYGDRSASICFGIYHGDSHSVQGRGHNLANPQTGHVSAADFIPPAECAISAIRAAGRSRRYRATIIHSLNSSR